MDFFGAKDVRSPVQDEDTDPFAAAIGRRFSSGTTSLLTSYLPPTPATSHPEPPLFLPPSTPKSKSRPPLLVAGTPSGPLSELSLTSPPPPSTSSQSRSPAPSLSALASSSISNPYPRFVPLPSSAIPPLLRSASASSSSSSTISKGSSSLLILDIRGHNTFLNARVHNAINLSVPSTLLKRPAFSLAKLTEMLPTAVDRAAFSAWRTSNQIVVYDTDSVSLTEGSTLLGVLRKFEKEGFQGNLGYVQGGFTAVWRHQRDAIDQGPVSASSVSEESEASGKLHSRHLPMAAFQQDSTTIAGKRGFLAGDSLNASNHPLHTTTRVTAANPFYDNIRQNMELASGITERIPLNLSDRVRRRQDELPFDWLREIVRKTDSTSPNGQVGGEMLEALAMQFYRIELGEQRRLQGVMEHHSKESVVPLKEGEVPTWDTKFPYSITAGVEKGTKNRYTNIWPFEHARVRLQTATDDYINASYIQPRGTRNSYIATQGPLASTFTDFWTLCWEQNVSIIVMLTKQVEGSSIKCHNYWADERYGPLNLQLVSVEGPTQLESQTASDIMKSAGAGNLRGGFDFGVSPATPASDQPQQEMIIRRTFTLTNTSLPNAPPRKVVQLQYVGWPDYEVPSSADHLLDLIKQVSALRDSNAQSRDPRTGLPTHPDPVLVHCSAGVGRTGSFVMVDAILDAIRRELRGGSKQLEPSSSTSTQGDESEDLEMETDEEPSNIVRLDSKGKLVAPGKHTIKKRRSSSGTGGSMGGMSMVALSELRLAAAKGGLHGHQSDSVSSSLSSSVNTNPGLTVPHPSTASPLAMDWDRSSPISASSQPRTFDASSNLSAGIVKSPSPMRKSDEREDSPLTGTSSMHNSSVPSHLRHPKTPSSVSSSTSGHRSSSVAPSTASTGATSVSSGTDDKSNLARRRGPGLNLSLPSSALSTTSLPEASAPSPRVLSPRLTSTSFKPSSSLTNNPSAFQDAHINVSRSAFNGTRSTSAPFSDASRSPSPTEESPKLNDNKISDHASKARAGEASATPDSGRHAGSTSRSAYDYTAPKKLRLPPNVVSHYSLAGPMSFPNGSNQSPPNSDLPSPLTSLNEPVREILEDMRMQRMSLCQSLRQYVFVHAAILEGALDVVDEIKAEDAKADARSRRKDSAGGLQPQSALKVSAVPPTLSRDKRRATATELPRADARGNIALHKRPSIKRKHHSPDTYEDDRMAIDTP